MNKIFTVYGAKIEFFDQPESDFRQVVIVLDDIKGMFIRRITDTEKYFVVITNFGYVQVNDRDWFDIKNILSGIRENK